MKQLNIGVLGLGEHGKRAHLDHLARDPRVKVVAGFDPDAVKSREFEEQFAGSVAVESERKLIGSEVDAVLVMTPDRFHAASTLAALEAGKHVMCEKPMADNAENFKVFNKSLYIAEKDGLVLSTCHPRRFDRPFLWVKRNLDSLMAKYGRVLDFDFDFSYHKPSKQGLHVGLLIDHVNHEVDLMNYLFGFDGFEAIKLNDSETRYRVAGQRSDGISFAFSGSRMLNERIYPEYMRIRFERAELTLDTKSGVAKIADHEEQRVEDVNIGPTDYEGRFAGINRNFVEAILGQTPSYITDKEMLMNTESGIALTDRGRITI